MNASNGIRFKLELIIGLACLVISLVPLPSYSAPFWGLERFGSDLASETGVEAIRIVPNSPVASAGLQKGDRILSVNGTAANSRSIRPALEHIKPSENVAIEIVRDGQPRTLTAVCGSPQVEAVLLIDDQTITALIALGLVIVLLVLHWLKPAPIYRALVALLAGLGIVVAVVATEIGQRSFPYQILWKSEAVQYRSPNDPSTTLHNAIVGALLLLGLALVILEVAAVWKLRARRPGVQISQ